MFAFLRLLNTFSSLAKMSSLFRSEEMTLAQLFLQAEAAYSCVSELGELGLVQFRDLNPDVNAFQRKFVVEVRRCEEMERKLRFLDKEIEKADIHVTDTGENPEAPQLREMIDLEAQFEQLENEMKDSNANYEALMKSCLELTELKHILHKTYTFFEEAELHVESQQQQLHEPRGTDEMQSLLGDEPSLSAAGMSATQLGFVTGVIARERVPSIERLLWRACRGNVYFKQAEIETPLEDPSTGDQVNTCVFIIFFQGDQLKTRVKKICEGFRASLYPCPDTAAERREMAIGVNTRIEDLQAVLNETRDHRHRLLTMVAKNINQWFIKVKKIKAIYHTMNMFNLDVTQKCLIAECWCPVSDLNKIQQALRRGTERSGAAVPSILNRMATQQEPPTFNRTNKFTQGFQVIVDAYGVANYQEVNPALFTIITFPFLFAVMFGDCGHGLIMFLFALWLVLKEKQLQNYKGGEIFETIFAGRYIILLMGLFSIYTGLIYNDCFSKSFNIFGTAWDLSVDWGAISKEAMDSYGNKSKAIMIDPKKTYRGVPYFFGIDPIWQVAENKLTFTNSFKMKLSIVFGVTHMMFGVCLSFFNHRHFKKRLNIVAEFIPQVLFLFCIFGYLVIMIFYKWIAINVNSSNQASLLLALINMFLQFGSKIEGPDLLYNGQAVIQPLLVVVAVLCVPWMLLLKPLYLRRQHNINRQGFRRLRSSSPSPPLSVSVQIGDSEQELGEVVYHDSQTQDEAENDDDHEEFDFGEVFIHQAVHTIEYCLGCISNTASYLRLWALSLAHAELSEVLWNMVLHIGLKFTGVLGVVACFVLFTYWAVKTIAILLIMEGLSAFLHALRLHWVEFQTKFYQGTGYKFEPFSFKLIISGQLEE